MIYLAIISLTALVIGMSLIIRSQSDKASYRFLIFVQIALALVLYKVSSSIFKPEHGFFSNEWAFFGLFLVFVLILGLFNRGIIFKRQID